MMLLGSLIIGLLTAAAVVAVVMGIVGTTDPVAQRSPVDWPRIGSIAGGGLLAVVAWAVTGWPVAAVAAIGVAVLAPQAIATARAQRRDQAMLDATRMWLLQLRTSLRAGVGLETALRETATQVGPDSIIGPPLRRMMATLELAGPTVALRRLAADVDNHVGDTAVTLLSSALEHSQHGVSEALAALGDWADQDLAHMRQVAAEARGIRLTRQIVTVIFVTLAAYLAWSSPELMAPYDTLMGQFVLLIIAVVAAVALWLLQQWSVVDRADRFFRRDEVTS